MKNQTITIKAKVEWSPWHEWEALLEDRRKGGIKLPYSVQGIYEIRKMSSDKRLFIGWTDRSLGRMVQECILHGRKDRPSSAGNRIRVNENTSKLEIRWGITERPRAVWEQLMKQHLKAHKCFPPYCP